MNIKQDSSKGFLLLELLLSCFILILSFSMVLSGIQLLHRHYHRYSHKLERFESMRRTQSNSELLTGRPYLPGFKRYALEIPSSFSLIWLEPL